MQLVNCSLFLFDVDRNHNFVLCYAVVISISTQPTNYILAVILLVWREMNELLDTDTNQIERLYEMILWDIKYQLELKIPCKQNIFYHILFLEIYLHPFSSK